MRSRAEAIESGGEAAGDRIKDDHDRWQATHRQGLRAKATSGTQHGTDAGLRAVLENNDCKVEQVQLYRLPAQDRRVVSNGETAQALGQGLFCVEERTAAEAAEILGCRVARVYRLVQLAKARMRKLMPSYTTGKAAIREAPQAQIVPVRPKHAPHFQGSPRRIRRLRVTRPSPARVGGFKGTARAAHKKQMPS